MDPVTSVFGLPSDVVAATLGDVGVEEVVDITTGVSATRGIFTSLIHAITFYFPSSSRTAWRSVLTGAWQNAT